MSKQLKLALGAGVLATAAVIASAATLGGVTSTQLGANSKDVASCDSTGVKVSYTTAYDVVAKAYQVTEVKLADVSTACNGQDVKITLYQGATSTSPDGTVIGTAEKIGATFATTPPNTTSGTATFAVVGAVETPAVLATPAVGSTPAVLAVPAFTPLPTVEAVTGVAVVISGNIVASTA